MTVTNILVATSKEDGVDIYGGDGVIFTDLSDAEYLDPATDIRARFLADLKATSALPLEVRGYAFAHMVLWLGDRMKYVKPENILATVDDVEEAILEWGEVTATQADMHRLRVTFEEATLMFLEAAK